MTSPKEYRRFALECDEKAAQSKDEQLRKLLKDESRLWYGTPSLGGLSTHVLERQQHFLAVLAHADDDKQ